jgi:hypothetical protein
MEASSSAVFHEDAAFQRADNWSFYGDEDGHIAVRKMSDGMLKITGMKGVLSSIILGFSQLQRENSPIWGAVSPAAAKLARRFDFVSSNAMPGGTALLHVMAKTVPGFPSVAKDGSLEDKEDGGAHKLLIGNKAYFASIMRNPDIQAKARRIPGISSIMAIIASK